MIISHCVFFFIPQLLLIGKNLAKSRLKRHSDIPQDYQPGPQTQKKFIKRKTNSPNPDDKNLGETRGDSILWNYMIRSVNQRIRNNVRSATQANRFSSSSTTVVASCKDGDTAKKAEESLRTVVSNIYVAEFTIESPRTLDRRKLRNLKSTLGVLAF
ncbi:hypothetical protein YC2023_076442 [Brassica napus]